MKGWRWFALLALTTTSVGCLAPPVIRGGGPSEFQIGRFPPGAEPLEIAVGDEGERLRGVFLAGDDPEAPLVVYYLPTGASVSSGWRGNPRFELVWNLRDRGFSLLMADYRGVGASDGDRNASQVAEDAWAIYGEALRRARNPERIVLRGNSLGALAVGAVLERGVSPMAVILLAPVLDDNVVYNVGRRHYGTILAWLADALVFRDPTGVDLPTALREAETAEILVITGDEDEFIGADGRERLEEAVSHARGHGVYLVEGPGFSHIDIGIEGQLVLPVEEALYRRLHSRTQTRRDSRRSRRFDASSEHSEALSTVYEKFRLDPPRAAIAAAAFLEQRTAAELTTAIDWFRSLPGRTPTDDEALARWFDFEDPSGPLDPAELEWCPHFAYRQLGSGDELPPPEEMVSIAKNARLHRRIFRYSENPRGFDRAWRFPQDLDLDRAVDGRPLAGLTTLPLRATLEPNDAFRQVVRLLLKSRRIPERVHRTADGTVSLEVRDGTDWRSLPLPNVAAKPLTPPDRQGSP